MFLQSLSSSKNLLFNTSYLSDKIQAPKNQIVFDLRLFTQNSSSFERQSIQFLNFSKLQSHDALASKVSSALEKSQGELSSVNHDCFKKRLDGEDRLVEFASLDGTIHYTLAYEGWVTRITNEITQETLIQTMNQEGKVVHEVFPCGLEMHYEYHGEIPSKVILPDGSQISYQIKDNSVLVERSDREGKTQYEHEYQIIDDHHFRQKLIGNLGYLDEIYDESQKTLRVESSYLKQTDNFDEQRNLLSKTYENPLDNASIIYKDLQGELAALEGCLLDEYFRVVAKDGLQCFYDDEGRLIEKKSSGKSAQYAYDALNRLISITLGDTHIEYTYDLLGRRLSKKNRVSRRS